MGGAAVVAGTRPVVTPGAQLRFHVVSYEGPNPNTCFTRELKMVDPRGSGQLFFMFIRPQPYTCLGIECHTHAHTDTHTDPLHAASVAPRARRALHHSSAASSVDFLSRATLMAILRSIEHALCSQMRSRLQVTLSLSLTLGLHDDLLVLFVILQVKGPLEREWHAATGRPARREHRVARGAIS